MGYRSLKRVLGETNLERKCRRLFGVCMLVLIFVAFFGVDRIGEDLAQRITLSKGSERVKVVLFDLHWQRWSTKPSEKDLQSELSRQILGEDYKGRFLALEPFPGTFVAETPEEENLLRELKREQEKQLATLLKQSRVQAKTDAATPAGSVPEGNVEKVRELQERLAGMPPIESLHRTRAAPDSDDPESGKYYYYEPVYWQNGCIRCHEGMYGKYASSAADDAATTEDFPFRAVRVTLPYGETRAAINWTRAVLLAVGILTVFLAMIALWIVVRYVVVKPLTHLRDVSETVAKGDLDQRADIHTSDEFEELAASFNKMLRNLTESQAAIRQVNTDLDAKVDQLAQLNMRLHEMNRLKGEFLANMSHELRTPLNSIIGFSEVLQGIDSLSDKQKRYAQNIQKSGRILLDMINDILDLAKMEAGKMDVRLSEFRIDSIIHAQSDMVRSLTEDKNIDLLVEIETDLPMMFQDQAKVQQILTNLLSNAIKFTPEGGRIVVGARGTPRGMIEVWVADTGVGIADADREIIFEKFRQGAMAAGKDNDNLTREYSGTGLGLSIVKELCKLLGGEITVESELGKGSTFRVFLPWMRADIAQAAAKLNTRLDEINKPRRMDFQPAAPAAT